MSISNVLSGACVVLAFSGGAAGAPAGEPVCSRVLPGPTFPRAQIVDEDTVRDHALVGPSGREGLLFVHWRPSPLAHPQTRHYLQSGVPDGTGGLALGDAIDLPDPDRYSRPRSVTTGDLDGDGTLDAVVYWAPGSSGLLAIDFLRGLGQGRYAPPVQASTFAAHFANPLIGDFDGDDKFEVAVFVNSQLVIVGIDGGDWLVESILSVESSLSHVVLDWNDDGFDDIALLNSTGTIAIRMGEATAPMSAIETVGVGYPVMGLSTLNGKLLALEGVRNYFRWTVEAVHQLEREAPEAWSIEMPENTNRVHPPFDLDGDGLEELIHGDTGHFFWGGTSGFRIRWGQPSGAPTPGPSSAARSYVIASPDLNADGVRDLVTSDYAIVIQQAPRDIEEGLYATTTWDDGFIDEPYLTVAVADLDEDGLDDVVFESFYPHVLGVGRSRGDGSFDVTRLDASPWDFYDPILLDLDGDGHVDLSGERGTRSVAWGRGDGKFGPFDVGPRDFTGTSRRYGELNGDGSPDRVEVLCPDYNCDPIRIVTALGAQRTWQETPFILELPAADYRRTWAIADLDDDGLDDLAITRRIAGSSRGVRLVWRRSLGDGSFGEETEVIDVDFPDGLVSIIPTDFDLDGVADLFLKPSQWNDTPLTSVRSDGRGGFQVVWSGPHTFPKYGVEDRLYDVDGDGRPDLVSGQYSGWLSPFYRVEIRRGDGLGGFLPAEPTVWRGVPGPPGVFRRDGTRDLVRLMEFNSLRLNLELFPSSGHVLPRDVAPPTVEIELTPAGEVSHWRITAVPLDECDDAPRIVRRVVEMLPARRSAGTPRVPPGGRGTVQVRPHPAPAFRTAQQAELRIYEVPGVGTIDVLLLGPDEAEARDLYDAAVLQGGPGFDHFGVLELSIAGEHGDEPGPTVPGSRLAQRFVFEDGRLAAAFVTRPGADLTFAVDALDRSGRRGTTRLSFAGTVVSP